MKLFLYCFFSVYKFVNLNHNFIANGIVVSNCSVRLLKTNLTFGDIEKKKKEIQGKPSEAKPKTENKKDEVAAASSKDDFKIKQ
jgi:RNA-splicing ligase RtcB